MHAAYWHKSGIDIYKISDKGVNKAASGQVDELKPINPFGKRPLVVGREMFFHIRKRYPVMDEKHLGKAVNMEIKDIVPIPDPSFCFKVFDRAKMHIIVDIWAWDAVFADRIRNIFNFTHIIPEDLVFVSDKSEVLMYGFKDMSHAVAYSSGRFLGSNSFSGGITMQALNLFIKSLGGYSPDLNILRVYGKAPFDIELPGMKIIKEKDTGYPVCLNYLTHLNLRYFRTKRKGGYLADIKLVSRVIIYIMLGYSFLLYLNIRNYEYSLGMLNKKIEELSKKANISMQEKKDDYSEVLSELQDKLKARVSPLDVMEIFAASLPEKSFLTRMTINERKADVIMTSSEPLNVIKTLSQSKDVKSVKLKGAIYKDINTGNYNFAIEVKM